MGKIGRPMNFMQKTRDLVFAYWIVVLSPFLLLAPLLLARKTLFWGTPSLQFVPWWSYALKSLQQGSLPLWNPLNGMGAPLLANYQAAFLYPPNWVLLIAGRIGGDPGIAFMYTLLAGGHLAWAGLGMAILLKRFHFSSLAQTMGGIAFGLSGFLTARLGFFSMVWAGAWLPWVILCTDQIASPYAGSSVGEQPAKNSDKMTLSVGLSACLAMQLLAGHAQTTWYSLILAGGWVTLGALRSKSWKYLGKSWSSFFISALVAAGLAAVQLVPTFEYLQNSQRADAYAYEEAMTYSFWPWRLVTMFSPDFFGNPANGNYWGYASYWEDHSYLGIFPLILGFASLRVIIPQVNPAQKRSYGLLVIGCWFLIIFSILLALGKNTPVFPFFYQYIPSFGMFQAPTRFMIWATFGLLLLSAVGIDRWRCPIGKGLYWFRLATAGAFAITLGAGLAWLLLDAVNLTFIKSTALTGFWGLCFGLLTLLIPLAEKKGRLPLWRFSVILVTLADLLLVGWNLNPGVNLGFYAENAANGGGDGSIKMGGRIYMDPQDEYDLKFKRFLRFKDFQALEDWSMMRKVLLPNLNLLEGIALVTNFDPLVPWRYLQWTEELSSMEPVTQAAWLAYSNVDYIEKIDLREESGVRFDLIQRAQRWHWYACSTPVESAEEAWSVLLTEFSNPPDENRSVVLETTSTSSSMNCVIQRAAQVRMISERPDQVSFQVDTSSPGWLQLMDAWYPGWVATVSGRKSPIVPADFLFKAVYVEPGSHIVTLSYRPAGFYFAGLFSILVLLSGIGLLRRKLL